MTTTIHHGMMTSLCSMSTQRGLRILALHSFRTSGLIFEKQLRISGLYTVLTEELKAELTFVNAPRKASGPIPQDVLMAFPSDAYYEWWNATLDEEKNTWHYDHCDESLEYLHHVWEEHGGFDGIVGFSQGGAIAALFAAMMVRRGSPPRFIICISGIKVRDGRFDAYYKAIADLPSAHIVGQHDPVKILTNRLVKCFASPVVLTHDRGHVVPRLHPDMSTTLKNFIAMHGMSSRI